MNVRLLQRQLVPGFAASINSGVRRDRDQLIRKDLNLPLAHCHSRPIALLKFPINFHGSRLKREVIRVQKQLLCAASFDQVCLCHLVQHFPIRGKQLDCFDCAISRLCQCTKLLDTAAEAHLQICVPFRKPTCFQKIRKQVQKLIPLHQNIREEAKYHVCAIAILYPFCVARKIDLAGFQEFHHACLDRPECRSVVQQIRLTRFKNPMFFQRILKDLIEHLQKLPAILMLPQLLHPDACQSIGNAFFGCIGSLI